MNSKTTSTPSAAFTLVELLVVIAIVAVLIGTLLPAINAARESARRATCQSNLHQLSSAIQSYYEAHGHLPPGVTNPTGPITNLPTGVDRSWVVEILPNLDEGNLYQHIDLSKSIYDPVNQRARSIHVGAVICPSNGTWLGGPSAYGHYAGVHHHVEAPIDVGNQGVLFLNSKITNGDISDGQGYTLMLGDKRIDHPLTDLGWASGTAATLRNTGTEINRTGRKPPAASASLNQEEVFEQGNSATDAIFVGGFGSDHTNGANFAFVDGHVRFLTSDLDAQILRQIGHRADGQLLDITDVE